MAEMVVRKPGIRADDIFFPAMGCLILAIVVSGFGRSYFFAGMMLARLPNKLVHVHGAVFVLWIFLLVVQPWLVSAHKLRWHMKLGVLSVVLLPAMSILGILTLLDFIRRAQPDDGLELTLVGDMEILMLFVGLTTWGLLARRDSTAHKRLMILGTMAIMGPAIGRWNVGLPLTLGVIFALPLLVLAYDLWALKRVHRTTTIAVSLTAAWALTLAPFSNLAIWHRCVDWIRHS
ncbi:MAG TPA: hypothetical protein VIJ53_03920 [Acidobacteriaceae bacterium]